MSEVAVAVRWSVYRRLAAARERCSNPKHNRFASYGGRGIEYRLPPGKAGVELILARLGPPADGKSLDRIDNDGHYEIDNLRWASASEQTLNSRQTPLLVEARRMNLAKRKPHPPPVKYRMPDGRPARQVARENGVGDASFKSRVFLGWSPERAATEPVRRRKRRAKAVQLELFEANEGSRDQCQSGTDAAGNELP